MPDTTTTEAAPELRGRLVLATGTVVKVSAESAAQVTAHHDPKTRETVPVTGHYVVND